MSKSSMHTKGTVVLVQGKLWLVTTGNKRDLFAPAAYVRDGELASGAQPMGTFLKFLTNADDPSGDEVVSEELAQQILDLSKTKEYREQWGRKE